jgi:modulator of FtsH protease
VNAAYDAAQWQDFAVAVAGATAALAGLLVVAVSINVREILSDSRTVQRAVSTLIALTTPLVIAVLLLIPGQSNTALGIELVVVGLVVGAVLAPLNSPVGLQPERTMGQWYIGSAIPITLLVVPTIIGGIGTATDTLGGLYWLPPAVIVTVVSALAQAWVLLIEILR